jgi:hypothetical protein
MVTCPDSVDGLGDDQPVVGHIQRWAVGPAPDEDVVDASASFEWHLAGSDQRVAGCEGVSRFVGIRGRSGVFVAHAGAFQRLCTGQEPDAGRVGSGVEVTEEHDRNVVSSGNEVLDEPGCGDGLLFSDAFQVEVVGAAVVNGQQRTERRRQE